MMRRTALILTGLSLPFSAHGQSTDSVTRVTPGIGVATEDGPDSIDVNPALFGFDSDPGVSLLYRNDRQDTSSSFDFDSSLGGLGVGVSYLNTPLFDTWWSLSTSLALHLDRRLVLGTQVVWNLPEGADNNFTSWNLGLGWRPLHWIGAGGVAWNIGSPEPDLGVQSGYGVGLAIRPLGNALTLGTDYLFDDENIGEQDSTFRLTLRAAPLRGLILRAYGTDKMDFGGGIQVAWGGVGTGIYAESRGMSASDMAFTGSIVSLPPDETLVGGKRKVPEYNLGDLLPYEARNGLFAPRVDETYLHLLKRLQGAATDSRVRGVVIHLDDSPFSMAQAEEMRSLIARIQGSGRPVVAYLDQGTDNLAYFLASGADRIYIHPSADLELTGLAAELTFFRGTLDLVGIEPQFFRRAEYKSAIEQYTNHEPSPASAEQTNTLLDDLSGILVQAIADGRHHSSTEVQAWIDGGPWTAQEATERGIVDGTLYPDELEEGLESDLGKNYDLDDGYLVDDERSGWTNPKRIAVVVVSGVIASGESTAPGLLSGEVTGSETVVQALKQARDDSTVKAVVLRVDSPGGSAFASEDIWRAVEQVKEAGKPVVVSMGGLAASGGYYVASGATAIYAEPSTITGSIGVFGGKLSAAGLYDKIGLESTLFTRGRKAGMWSNSRPLDEVQADSVDRLVGSTYLQFKTRVAEGRGMELADVDTVARGRVWTGKRALEKNLVDRIGGFYDAVARAREEAGIRPGAQVDLITYKSEADSLGELPTQLVRAAMGPMDLSQGLRELGTWTRLKDERVLAIVPYTMEIR